MEAKTGKPGPRPLENSQGKRGPAKINWSGMQGTYQRRPPGTNPAKPWHRPLEASAACRYPVEGACAHQERAKRYLPCSFQAKERRPVRARREPVTDVAGRHQELCGKVGGLLRDFLNSPRLVAMGNQMPKFVSGVESGSCPSIAARSSSARRSWPLDPTARVRRAVHRSYFKMQSADYLK